MIAGAEAQGNSGLPSAVPGSLLKARRLWNSSSGVGWLDRYSQNAGPSLCKVFEPEKRRRGVRLPSFVPVIAPRNKLYPIGVLLELAPEPEVSTRITPD